jgi:ABC-type sugar transport system substrate-binding protein
VPIRRLCLLLAALAAAACARDDRGGRKLVGVTLLTQTHDFFKELERAVREEAARRGLELIVVSCEMDPAKQASQIEDFVAQRVSAILAAPCDSSAIIANFAGADSAGIPVFTVDIAARGGRVVSHVASDNVQGGRLAARTLLRYMDGAGKVLIIDHPTVASVQDRTRGFEEELRKHPDVTVVARPSADGQRAKPMAVMEDMLQAHPDLAGVFGINDDSALGALAVLEAAGRKDVVIVGFDATPEAQRAIRSGGPLKADVVQDPSRIGRTAVEMVARHLAGEPVPPVVAVEVGLFEKESAAGP